LAEFKRRLDEERNAADARMAKLREEYRGELAGLSEERTRLQEESRRKEAELRATMDAKTRAWKPRRPSTANLKSRNPNSPLSEERNP
jgi:hypothetical protein